MTFLSGETISQTLSKNNIITDSDNNNIFETKSVDCNSYRLHVGNKVAVTSTESNEPKEIYLKKNNYQSESFTIHSGQFAYILTEETINMPNNLMGFISIRSTDKIKGLINVSGFHVDPGYKGKLLFAVFNAGPNGLTFKRNQSLFNIWFSKIDEEGSIKVWDKSKIRKDIGEELNNLNGYIQSPQSLSNRLDKQTNDLNEKLSSEIKKINDKVWTHSKWILATIITFILSISAGFLIGIASEWSNNWIDYHAGFRQELREELINDIDAKLNRKELKEKQQRR